MSQNQHDKHEIISSLTGVIVIVAVAIGGVQLFLFVSQQLNTAHTPSVELPLVPQPQFTHLELLKSPYIPTSNPFSPDAYKRESIPIALNGDVSDLLLTVHGMITESGPHFILINIGTVNGVFNGVRNAPNSLDLFDTRSHGGVFEDQIEFSFTLDFMGDTFLSTTANEFMATKQQFKTVKLWDAIKPSPPTVVRLVVAPFNSAGNFGGGTITSLEVGYSCKEGSDCVVVACPTDEFYTQCLRNNFGSYAADMWCTNTSYCK